jgi:hypothetical protein
MRGGGFEHGCRNISCVIYAWLLRKKGFRPEVIRKEVTRLGRTCRPPLDERRVALAIKSGMDISKMSDKTIAAHLRVADDEARIIPRFWRGGLPPGVKHVIVTPFQRRNLIREIVSELGHRRLSCSDMQTALLLRGIN